MANPKISFFHIQIEVLMQHQLVTDILHIQHYLRKDIPYTQFSKEYYCNTHLTVRQPYSCRLRVTFVVIYDLNDCNDGVCNCH